MKRLIFPLVMALLLTGVVMVSCNKEEPTTQTNETVETQTEEVTTKSKKTTAKKTTTKNESEDETIDSSSTSSTTTISKSTTYKTRVKFTDGNKFTTSATPTTTTKSKSTTAKTVSTAPYSPEAPKVEQEIAKPSTSTNSNLTPEVPTLPDISGAPVVTDPPASSEVPEAPEAGSGSENETPPTIIGKLLDSLLNFFK
jgi:hypothetical protein